MNYNPLAYKATMHFECQTGFGRCVKFSCITMSLFIVVYIHFSCNVNKWLPLNTISLNIFDRVPVDFSEGKVIGYIIPSVYCIEINPPLV